MIVDGNDMVLGRLASEVAKRLMKGEEMHVINAEKIVVSGSTAYTMNDYMQKRRLQQKATPDFSPKWPKIPHLMVRRVIRGMLPFKKAKGRAAFKKLRVYAGDPGITGDILKLEVAKNRGFARKTTIAEMCRRLGASW